MKFETLAFTFVSVTFLVLTTGIVVSSCRDYKKPEPEPEPCREKVMTTTYHSCDPGAHIVALAGSFVCVCGPRSTEDGGAK